MEDTNGNGVFDPTVDASDLNTANPDLGTGCVKLKLQLLPDSSGWGVFAKPFDGYLPSANAMATSGRVTIVAPSNLPLSGFQFITGQWHLASTLYPYANPNRKYMTFELSANATNLGLSATDATLLFKFDKLGDCPDSLYLMENFVPAGLEPNDFSGLDPNSFTSSGFEYCGVYARKNWRCNGPTAPSGPIIIVTTDSLGTPQPEATDRDTDFSEGKTAKGQWFTASPNPAGEFVNIVLSADLAEGHPTLTLWDLQGKKRQEMVVGNVATQLDLGDLPAGVYLISLAQNGRVVERKKLVKK
ncbi:MAG: T9SS type A sorting domain-containing protein [Saprospiraceae bacterium]|nr:T9SS type A sorting domain-containing protein [Saprospiraceae bacterium]